MIRRSQRGQTLLELCTRRVGGGELRFRNVRAGAQLCEAVLDWAMASWVVGHFATVPEYVTVLGVSERGAFKRRARIRAAFSEEEFRELVGLVRQELVERFGPTRGELGVGQVAEARSLTTFRVASA